MNWSDWGPEDRSRSLSWPIAHSTRIRRCPHDPYRHLELVVQEPDQKGGYQETQWVRVEEMSGIGNQAVYRVEPVTGTLYFGSYSESTPDDQGGRSRPRGAGSWRKYRYVAADSAGNVPAGSINTQRHPKHEDPAGRQPRPGHGRNR